MPRELLHVSLGHEACHVSAHYLNLAGLSVTDGSTHNNEEGQTSSTCDPKITHTASHQSMWTPRVLMVDGPIGGGTVERSGSLETPSSILTAPLMTASSSAVLPSESTILNSALWNGPVEQIDLGGHNSHNSLHSLDPRVAAFREISAQASTSSFSRYRAPARRATTTPHYSLASNSHQRGVDWDNLSEEEEEEDEYAEEERRKRLEREEFQWKQSVYPQMQDQMESFWGSVLPSSTEQDPALHTDRNRVISESNTAASESEALHAATNNKNRNNPDSGADVVLHWKDYWMPPYQPSSILDLPNVNRDFWDYYYPLSQLDASVVPQTVREWIQDEFLDGRIRRLLEDMDSCQGVTICQSGTSGGALTTLLLEYLQEDCPGARRWLWSIQESKKATTEASWRTQRVQHVRQEIQHGLQWHDTMEYAHATLSLKGRAPGEDSQFIWSAKTAAALETATLAYRLSKKTRGSPSSRIGLNSYYYGNYSAQESPFGSVDSMSLAEFLATLVPAPGLSILELDTLMPSLKNDEVTRRLLEGTSFERDQRMKSGGSRPREELPGSWMMDAASGGILGSLSSYAETDRSVHTHFALAGSLRLGHSSQSLTTMPTTASTSSQYVDCLLQGMGLRYRPEQSLGVQLNQTLSYLTNSQGYGAGSYWKHVFPEYENKALLSVLGNTTRFHSTVSSMAASVKDALYAPRNKGFFSRDISQGILPEEDNCHDILSTLYNLRDRYQPGGELDDIENDM